MTAAIFLSTRGLFGLLEQNPPQVLEGRPNDSAKTFTKLALFDTGIVITTLIIGILGVMSQSGVLAGFGVHPSLSYSFVACGAVLLFYGVMLIQDIYINRTLNQLNRGDQDLLSEDLKDYFIKVIPQTLRALGCVITKGHDADYSSD